MLSTALLLIVGLLPGRTPLALAAEYTMETNATYTVQPDAGRVNVSVEVVFENTTPDPAGQFSLFEVVDLALQPGATEVAASDAAGALNVSVGERDEFTLVSVRPRQGVRYQQQARFTLTYRLPDGAAPGMRIRPSVVAFPVWSFGTAATVTVRVPDTYEVTVDGDVMEASRADGRVVLSSGRIDDPSAWLAKIVAVGAASYQTFSRAVPLGGATVDLQVRAWADDLDWGQATLDLLSAALPRLEQSIGMAYPEVGALTVTESVAAPSPGLDAGSTGTQIEAGYQEPPFTLLHQLAHVWFSEMLTTDRWVREGFASLAAADAAAQLRVEEPYDPAARTDELSAAAFPLVSWGAGDASAEQEAWAYAASWATAERIRQLVGASALERTWQRIGLDIGPYDAAPAEPPSPVAAGFPSLPVGSRELLDQLEAASGADVAPIFADAILADEDAAALPARAEARAAFSELLAAAGSWGAPEPIRLDMAGWRFAAAGERVAEALAWLHDRDDLLAAAEAAGLSVPSRLRDRWLSAGGGADARAELDAERAVVDSYAEALTLSREPRGPLEQVGLFGGTDPESLLLEARTRFSEGELRGAAESIDAARARLAEAAVTGAVRLAVAVVAPVLVVLFIVRLGRRSRSPSGSDYTAAP